MLPADWCRRYRGGLSRERPLASLTTWRIGGPAQLYLEPADTEELAGTVAQLKRVGLPFRILGGGSNLLVADRGVSGAVVSLRRLDRVSLTDGVVGAEAGAPLHRVVSFAAKAGRAGLESLAGIPGRLGGAVFGNAGSRHGSIGDRVLALDLLERDGSLTRVVPRDDFFAYRRSRVGDRVVVRVLLATGEGDPRRLRARLHQLLRERRRTQPGWIGNAGCVFRNPVAGGAGRLIDAADCKGMRAGGIFVSRRHANFFENGGGGRACDVERLVDRVRERVRQFHGVELQLEVRRWD